MLWDLQQDLQEGNGELQNTKENIKENINNFSYPPELQERLTNAAGTPAN